MLSRPQIGTRRTRASIHFRASQRKIVSGQPASPRVLKVGDGDQKFPRSTGLVRWHGVQRQERCNLIFIKPAGISPDHRRQKVDNEVRECEGFGQATFPSSFGPRSELQSKGDEDYYVEESFSIPTKMAEMLFQINMGGGRVDLELGVWCVR